MRVLGMLSGTSADGLDIAIADFTHADGVIALRPIATTTVELPVPLRTAALGVLPPATTTAEALTRLDTDFGRFCAGAAAPLVREHDVVLITSLGQTIFHWVEGGTARGTVQVGQPAWIAEETGVAVVSDLRARDIAAGGHGAPLASTLDALWLRTGGVDDARTGGVRAALNLGGIANITVVPGDPDAPVLGFDTGPANCLLDVVAERVTGRPYDVDGALAAQGTVVQPLLERMLTEPYFALPAPKSTGRELFTAEWIDLMVGGEQLHDPDLAATLVELTARTVAEACRVHGVTEVIGSGGGMRNPVLVARLREHLTADRTPATLRSTDELGLPADAKEAYLVALLGWLTWHGLPGVVPGGTGSRTPRILGRISPGAEPLRLPEPVPSVHRLEVVR